MTERPSDGAPHPPRRGRRPLALALLAAVTALIVFAIAWFEPQTLFFDDRVDEAAPAGATTELAAGTFVSLDHTTTGTALVVERPDGGRVLRLEDLDTSNGPDLFVYLSAAPPGADEQRYDDDIVDLGRLEGNIGSQNYDIPDDVDLERYRSVVIWCERFSVAFGAAGLA